MHQAACGFLTTTHFTLQHCIVGREPGSGSACDEVGHTEPILGDNSVLGLDLMHGMSQLVSP